MNYKPLLGSATGFIVKHRRPDSNIRQGCIACNRLGQLLDIQGNMFAEQYYDNFENRVVKSFEKLKKKEKK